MDSCDGCTSSRDERIEEEQSIDRRSRRKLLIVLYRSQRDFLPEQSTVHPSLVEEEGRGGGWTNR
jgi:hypothetical protein